MPLNCGAQLGSYEIKTLLGSGGMGEVYLAKDVRLGREVAIKVLWEEFASDPDRLSRFEQEARSASGLNHPNIITIHEIGQYGLTRYIAMEFVQGKTLRLILREGHLPIKRMLQLATQIAEGLAKAHAAGIVHRDLKPENLMLTEDGFVKILDFGLAKLAPQIAEGDSIASTLTKVTRQGTVVGTVGYMSPEQASGGAIDHRSDQFSFGLVLYEMAAGKHPFERKTAPQTLAAIIEDQPEAIATLNPDIPPAFALMIQRCLAKEADQRYESTRDLAQDLKAVLEDTTPRAKQGIRIESLAVLPLANMSGDPEQEYFSDGMTEAVITVLAKIGGLKVISRTSAMRYKHTDKSVPQIARELNVQAIVEGSVLRAGNRVRITAQLIEAASDKHLWAESYERDLQDILSLQNEVARAIAEEIQIQLSPQEKAVLRRSSRVNAEAQEAYLKGRFYVNKWSPEGLKKATEYFQTALTVDPEFAPAYAGLAEAYLSRGFWGLDSPREVARKARRLASHALGLDPDLAEARLALSNVKLFSDWDFTGAEDEVKRAIELNPNYAEAYGHSAVLHLGLGCYDAAQEEIELALRLDPHSIRFNLLVGISLFWQGRHEESIERCRRALRMDPNFHQPHFFLAMNYRKMGMHEEAVEEWKKLYRLAGSIALRFMDRAFRHSGLRGALVTAARFMKLGYFISKLLKYIPFIKRRYVPPILIALLYAEACEKDLMFRWLEKAYRERDPQILTLKASCWDDVRSDPRFENLMARIGIPG